MQMPDVGVTKIISDSKPLLGLSMFQRVQLRSAFRLQNVLFGP